MWTHIILEAYCGRKWSCVKDKYHYEVIDFKTYKTKKVLNPCYDPKYRTPRKPSYCPNHARYICLEKDCPHLGYTDAQPEDYEFLDKRYHKKVRK